MSKKMCEENNAPFLFAGILKLQTHHRLEAMNEF